LNVHGTIARQLEVLIAELSDAAAGFFQGMGKLGVWRRKSPSGEVQGTNWLGSRGRPPEANDML